VENFGGKIDHYIFFVGINSQTNVLKQNFLDLNFQGATSADMLNSTSLLL
jgi:hypothetical protein